MHVQHAAPALVALACGGRQQSCIAMLAVLGGRALSACLARAVALRCARACGGQGRGQAACMGPGACALVLLRTWQRRMPARAYTRVARTQPALHVPSSGAGWMMACGAGQQHASGAVRAACFLHHGWRMVAFWSAQQPAKCVFFSSRRRPPRPASYCCFATTSFFHLPCTEVSPPFFFGAPSVLAGPATQPARPLPAPQVVCPAPQRAMASRRAKTRTRLLQSNAARSSAVAWQFAAAAALLLTLAAAADKPAPPQARARQHA